MAAMLRCPICAKTFTADQTEAPPFCSERCRTIDLGRWLGEHYSVPVVPDPDGPDLDEPVPSSAREPAAPSRASHPPERSL